MNRYYWKRDRNTGEIKIFDRMFDSVIARAQYQEAGTLIVRCLNRVDEWEKLDKVAIKGVDNVQPK